jgi:hypothetical protein
MYWLFLGRDWLKIRGEMTPDPQLVSGRPQVSVVLFQFFFFIIVSACFLLNLSIISSGID